MKNTLSILTAVLFIFLFACNRENLSFQKQQDDPILKRTVTRDTAGNNTTVTNYNNKGLPVNDTAYSKTGVVNAYRLYEYNNKGKRTRLTTVVPSLNSTGYLWLDEDDYLDDTLPVVTRHFLKGSITALTKHFYNASRQLILDSTYHLGYTVASNKKTFTYDAQGRLATNTAFNNSGDSTLLLSYQYSTNRMEELRTSYSYGPVFKSYSKTVTDFTATGDLLSEKVYSSLTQLYSQKDYTYDAAGHLLKQTTITTGSPTSEVRYFNNPATGKPERSEGYLDNILLSVTVYYYE